jgi:hypothetical protein
MKKNVIRLTESDLEKIVRKVIMEQMSGVAFGAEGNGLKVKKEDKGEEMFAKSDNIMTHYRDTMDNRVMGDIEFSEKKEFGPEDYDSFMEYINNCDTRWCLTTKKFYDKYAEKGNITVGKGRRR